MPVTIVIAAAAAAAAIAKAVASVKDMKMRRDIERAIGMLTQIQKDELGKQLLATQSQDKHLEILYNAVAKIIGSQSAAIITASIKARKDDIVKRERTTAIVVLGGAIAIVIAIYLLKKT
jgi:hypothetical protein